MSTRRVTSRVGLPPLDPERFRRLPEPVRLEDTRTSEESLAFAPEKAQALQEQEWLLRTSPG